MTPEFSRDQHTYDLKEPIADYDDLYAVTALAPEFRDAEKIIKYTASAWANTWRYVSTVDGVAESVVT